MKHVRRGRWAALLCAGACIGWTAQAVAAERSHTVAPGESASVIAKRYYGDHELAGLLLRLNGRSGTVIRPGETLRVPFCSLHTVQAGDTWSKLSERYLGRASAWPEIAELNGLDRADPLRVGQRLVMPVVLEHALDRGESLASLAERYYGDPHRARLLQSFNGIEDPRALSVGRRVEVPLTTLLAVGTKASTEDRVARTTATSGTPGDPRPVTVQVAGKVAAIETSKTAEAEPVEVPTPGAPARSDPDGAPSRTDETAAVRRDGEEATASRAGDDPTVAPKPAEAGASVEDAAVERARVQQSLERKAVLRLRAVVQAAQRAYDAGEFERAEELLVAQRAAIAGMDDPGARAEYWRLMTFVEIAFDRREEACAAWRALGDERSRVALEEDLVSPKLRDTVEACGG